MSHILASIETPIKKISVGDVFGVYNVSSLHFSSTPTPHASIWASVSGVEKQIGVAYSSEIITTYLYN